MSDEKNQADYLLDVVVHDLSRNEVEAGRFLTATYKTKTKAKAHHYKDVIEVPIDDGAKFNTIETQVRAIRACSPSSTKPSELKNTFFTNAETNVKYSVICTNFKETDKSLYKSRCSHDLNEWCKLCMKIGH